MASKKEKKALFDLMQKRGLINYDELNNKYKDRYLENAVENGELNAKDDKVVKERANLLKQGYLPSAEELTGAWTNRIEKDVADDGKLSALNSAMVPIAGFTNSATNFAIGGVNMIGTPVKHLLGGKGELIDTSLVEGNPVTNAIGNVYGTDSATYKTANVFNQLEQGLGQVVSQMLMQGATLGQVNNALISRGVDPATISKVINAVQTGDTALRFANQKGMEYENQGGSYGIGYLKNIPQAGLQGYIETNLGAGTNAIRSSLGYGTSGLLKGKIAGTQLVKDLEKSAWGRAIVNSIKSAVGEGTEELLQNIGEDVYDKLLNPQLENASKSFEQIVKDALTSAGYGAITGAITGVGDTNTRIDYDWRNQTEDDLISKGYDKKTARDIADRMNDERNKLLEKASKNQNTDWQNVGTNRKVDVEANNDIDVLYEELLDPEIVQEVTAGNDANFVGILQQDLNTANIAQEDIALLKANYGKENFKDVVSQVYNKYKQGNSEAQTDATSDLKAQSEQYDNVTQPNEENAGKGQNIANGEASNEQKQEPQKKKRGRPKKTKDEGLNTILNATDNVVKDEEYYRKKNEEIINGYEARRRAYQERNKRDVLNRLINEEKAKLEKNKQDTQNQEVSKENSKKPSKSKDKNAKNQNNSKGKTNAETLVDTTKESETKPKKNNKKVSQNEDANRIDELENQSKKLKEMLSTLTDSNMKAQVEETIGELDKEINEKSEEVKEEKPKKASKPKKETKVEEKEETKTELTDKEKKDLIGSLLERVDDANSFKEDVAKLEEEISKHKEGDKWGRGNKLYKTWVKQLNDVKERLANEQKQGKEIQDKLLDSGLSKTDINSLMKQVRQESDEAFDYLTKNNQTEETTPASQVVADVAKTEEGYNNDRIINKYRSEIQKIANDWKNKTKDFDGATLNEILGGKTGRLDSENQEYAEVRNSYKVMQSSILKLQKKIEDRIAKLEGKEVVTQNKKTPKQIEQEAMQQDIQDDNKGSYFEETKLLDERKEYYTDWEISKLENRNEQLRKQISNLEKDKSNSNKISDKQKEIDNNTNRISELKKENLERKDRFELEVNNALKKFEIDGDTEGISTKYNTKGITREIKNIDKEIDELYDEKNLERNSDKLKSQEDRYYADELVFQRKIYTEALERANNTTLKEQEYKNDKSRPITKEYITQELNSLVENFNKTYEVDKSSTRYLTNLKETTKDMKKGSRLIEDKYNNSDYKITYENGEFTLKQSKGKEVVFEKTYKTIDGVANRIEALSKGETKIKHSIFESEHNYDSLDANEKKASLIDFAKQLGRETKFYVNKNKNDVALYNPNDGAIWINENALDKASKSTIMHEALHSIKDKDENAYRKIGLYVLTDAYTIEELENEKNRIKDLYKRNGWELKSDADIYEEIIANFMSNLDDKRVSKLAQGKSNKGWLTKIKNWLVDQYYEVTGKTTKNGYLAKDIRELENTFAKALGETKTLDINEYTNYKDANGKPLTKNQIEFYKYSVMRDNNGNLKVYYHSSDNAGFLVFDPKMSDDKISLFFSDDLKVARTYLLRNKKNKEIINTNEKDIKNKEKIQEKYNSYEKEYSDIIGFENGSNFNEIFTSARKELTKLIEEIDRLNFEIDISEGEMENENRPKINKIKQQLKDDFGFNDYTLGQLDNLGNEEMPIDEFLNTKIENLVDKEEVKYIFEKKIKLLNEMSNEYFNDFNDGNDKYEFKLNDENGKISLDRYKDGKLERKFDANAHYLLKDLNNILDFEIKEALDNAKQNIRSKGKTYAVYLNIKNPLIVNTSENDLTPWNKIPFNGREITTRGLAKYAKENGYDGLVINNIFDLGQRPEFSEGYYEELKSIRDKMDETRKRLKDLKNKNPILEVFGRESTIDIYKNEWSEIDSLENVLKNLREEEENLENAELKKWSSQIVVAFNSNQVKDINNFAPTEAKEIHHSIQESDEKIQQYAEKITNPKRKEISSKLADSIDVEAVKLHSISNRKTMTRAKIILNNQKGNNYVEKAKYVADNWESVKQDNKMTLTEMVALEEQVSSVLDKVGDTDTAQKMVQIASNNYSDIARALQMAHKFSKPTYQKIIQGMVNELNKETGAKNQIKLTTKEVNDIAEQFKALDDATDLTNEELIKQLKQGFKEDKTLHGFERNLLGAYLDHQVTQTEYSLNELVSFRKQQIYKNSIISKYKATMGNKIKSYVRINHLLNAKTALKNIISTQSYAKINRVLSDLSGIITNDSSMRTIGGETKKAINQKAWHNLGKQSFEIIAGFAGEGNYKYNDYVTKAGAFSGKGFVNKLFSPFEKANQISMGATDGFFKSKEADMYIEQMANVLTEQEFIDNYQDIVKDAKEYANRVTFNDKNWFSDMFVNAKEGMNKMSKAFLKPLHISGDYGLGDITMMYARTPANVVYAGIQLSPLGWIKAGVEFVKYNKVKKGGNRYQTIKAKNEAKLSFAKANAGFLGLMALGAMLRSLGVLSFSGHDDDDKKEQLYQEMGLSGTKLNLSQIIRLLGGERTKGEQDGDLLVDGAWVEPLSTTIFAGGLIWEAVYEDTGKAFTSSICNDLISYPCEKTIDTFLRSWDYGDKEDGNRLYKALGSTLVQQLTGSFVPLNSARKQFASAVDPIQRNIYPSKKNEDGTDKGWWKQQLEYFANYNKNSSFLLKDQLEARTDTFGDEMQYNNLSKGQRIAVAMSPFQFTNVKRRESVDILLDATKGIDITPTMLPKTSAPSKTEYGKANSGVKSGTELTEKQKEAYLEEYNRLYEKYFIKKLKELDIANKSDATREKFFDSEGDIDETYRSLLRDIKKQAERYAIQNGNNINDYNEVNLNNRPKISSQDMQKAGWNVEDGTYSTLYSSTYYASDFGLDGNDVIVVTPIISKNEILTPRELEKYAKKILNGEKVNKKILLGKFNNKKEANEYANNLHKQQEKIYN